MANREAEQKNLEKLTDIIEEVEISEKEQQKIKAALEWISVSLKRDNVEQPRKEVLPVSAEDVKLVVEQFEISNADAETALRNHNGDVYQTLLFLSQ